MFEGAVAGILNRLLGKYVQDLDTENLNVGIFSGNVNLTDLKLKPEALYELDLPIDVKIGTIGRISLQIPWSGLYTQPVIVNIEDVLLLVGPAISNSYFDPERERRLTRAAKRKILQDLEAESEILKGPQNFFENLFTAIVNNIQIYVRNVHVRYEDSISSKDGPLACGLCLASLSIETTNSKWKPAVTPGNASTVYQLMRVESLSLYWNPTATALEDAETAHITPMQYYNWKHYMLTGLDKFSMHREDFQFLVKPVSCKVKVLINRSGEARVPRLLVDGVFHDCALQLSRRQYLSIDNLLASFARIKLNRKYRHLHPGAPLSRGAKPWWRYAYTVVVEQRVRPYTWPAIKKHRENCNVYKQTYKSTLRSPNDTELKLDLQKCEDSLPIISVVIAREQAKFELLSQEPDRIEIVETEFDWWKPASPGEPEDQSHVELCVKTERSRSLWTHLSSPERKKVCELIGYVEGAPRQDKSKQYIEHKLNLTLANCSLTLLNRSKEIMVLTLTQFLASLETRPSARAYKVSCRAENIVAEGVTADGDMLPILTSERGSALTGTNLLALDLERNPSSSEADYGLCCLMEPLELIYIEHAFTELINFVQTRSMTSEELAEEVKSAASRAGDVSKSVLQYAASRKKVFQVNVDLKGPCVVLPEHGCVHKSGRVMVLDISRIVIKSDLQPSNLALEDATCMELEEKLYDRLHAECSAQVLYCEWSDPWRDSRRHADSELHLVPKVRVQVVFSNSIKKDYKLLPRYKLNISLSSFKLNLSDRIICHLLDFCDNLPLPTPTTVPVSFMDSGDYPEDAQDPELAAVLQLDLVEADPGYGSLVKLRQKIVAAYLSRNKATESTFDKASAKLGFTQADGVFASSEHSDEDMEVYARSVDLPGFDDNVSPSNTINTLLRFIVGEIVINLSRSIEQVDKPYIMLSITKVCLDVALMEYGPAVQLSVAQALLTDKQHHSSTGQYLELLTSGEELLNLLYRKVRANCPEFRSHFHAVEQALVVDMGQLALVLHAPALHTLFKYLQYIASKIQSRHSINFKSVVVPKTRSLWEYMMMPEADPPVPAGATKFSYSVRVSSICMKLCHSEWSSLELRLGALESDCVFRANERCIFKLFLSSMQLDELSDATLYPKLIWPDEDKVIELKYVRAAPRVYGTDQSMKAHGELRVYIGRVHVVVFCSVLHQLQHFLEPLIPSTVASEAAQAAERAAERHAQGFRAWTTRINLVIDIHAPVLLLPQKPSSPNLLVLNMGDLTIENFFKPVNANQEVTSPIQNPIIDNILIKLVNITFCRAVMTLAGTLEVQEAILEPICMRCDVKRAVCYQQFCSSSAHRDLLACSADVTMDELLVNVGQKDLATMLAVWSDNFSEENFTGSTEPSSPVEIQQADTTAKKLQAFFAQGEPIRKEANVRFTLEGIELKLFSDMDEVLSSPVRDLNHGLAKLTAGETTVQLDYCSDGSMEVKASLQSLLVEDIRPDPSVVIKRIFQSQGGSSRASVGISVRRPPLVDASLRVTGAKARQLDVRVDRTRLNLALPFLLQLARSLLDAMPGDKTMDGGVVNHGYVGEMAGFKPQPSNNNRTARPPSCSDSTSGYFSTGASLPEEPPGLSISIQFRQPEVMLFTDLTKSDGHALLLRAELLFDYSFHAGCETLVMSLAGLQVMSKLQSKLKNLPPQLVLKPCDLEFSQSLKSFEDGFHMKMSVSDIEMHIAATTVHTVVDLIEEISSELSIPEEREPFNFNNHYPRPEKLEEDLWLPKKLGPAPAANLNPSDSFVPRHDPVSNKPEQTFVMMVPKVRIIFEIEQSTRVPVLMLKLSGEMTLHDWGRLAHGTGSITAQASCYNERVDTWEPLIEPVVVNENIYRPWEISVTIFQDKPYTMSSRVESTAPETECDTSVTSDHSKRVRTRARSEFESETSADECDTDNEMTFIRNPAGRESRTGVELRAGSVPFLGGLELDDSDSDNENKLMDKLATAIGHLFTDESSAEEQSNDDDSSAPASEPEPEDEETEKAVTFIDGACKGNKEAHKTVTLPYVQEASREDSMDSGLEVESYSDKRCTYVLLEARDMMNVTVTPATARVLLALAAACTDRAAAVTAIVAAESGLHLINDIGPGSTVHLKTRAETDLAGNDRVIAIADYDVDTSRPSTPGCDTSSADVLDEADEKQKPEMSDISDEWDCFEGGFPGGQMSPPAARQWSPRAPPPPPALHTKLTDLTLTVRLHDLDHLTILCPQRTVSKLHVLHPSKNATRYYIAVDRTSKYNVKKIVVRSPLQVRNETSYALELFYNAKDLRAIGAELIGSLTNPFDDKMRLAVIAPQQTYNVPLYIAYHCKLYLLPSNFESYQTATQGIWWMELANDLGTPRDMICPAKADTDKRIFAMRILAVEGCQSHKVSRCIPNYLVRVVPPLALYNRLPYAIEVSCPATEWRVRIEAGERTHTYTLPLTQPQRLHINMHYMNAAWSGSFTLTPELTEKMVSLSSLQGESVAPRVQVCVRAARADCVQLYVHAQHWIINKTNLPLHMKGRHSDVTYELTEEPLLWSPMGRGWAGRCPRVRFRAHHSAWSRAARLPAAAPGLVVCPHTERQTNYRLLLNVTLSELCPQLTKIVTLLPYFLVYNETKRHLRFMEENEAADLWMDLAPQQCTPLWPQTDSMAMRCKLRDSMVVSQHFPIATNHFTVLRMDKGSAICVEVTGGTDRPFTITFKQYNAGDAPVRIDNLCDDLFLKLHQADSGQVALLSPYHSMLYTWDDPGKERTLMWNIYNNKGKGIVADFNQDGYGEEKVSFHSVKHSTLVATSSVTSKLSSTFKRLTPKSPEPCDSSSDDSDSSDLPEAQAKSKKMRKDKVIVYWVSYMDGYQRVLVLAQDERIAYQYRAKITHGERSHCEVYMSLSGVSLSVCVQTNDAVKELAYVSVTDSLPRWEVNVNHKWKQLTPDLNTWIEDKYQTEQKKCELKEYIHIDLEKMQMTKPFFSELRRTYNPGIWLQLRKSETHTYCHFKVQRLQVDNQLNEAVFPSVLYPAPLPADLRTSVQKPCIEIVALKQYRPSLNQDVYKYLKVLVQEFCINLDRGFVNYVFDILNHWKMEEKPAVRLRADLALVHMPLPIIAFKSQNSGQRYVVFEFVHLSPVKLVLSLSSRGYLADNTSSPARTRLGNKKENRPKLFNSDLLEYLFNSWGSSLCDMKDVVLRMSYLEVRHAPITPQGLLDAASRHYWTQLVQQFYVLVLGLNILGNPYSYIGDFSRGLKHYYEPCCGTALGRRSLQISSRLMRGAGALLGLTSRGAAPFPDQRPVPRIYKRKPGGECAGNDLPESVVGADGASAASLALALTALVARPTFDMCRAAGGAGAGAMGAGVSSAERALRACASGRVLARRRMPRHCQIGEGVRPYSVHEALGAALAAATTRGPLAPGHYLAHAMLPPAFTTTLLLSTEHLYMVRLGGASGACHVEWAVKLDDLIDTPRGDGDKLVLNIKQDEMVNYFSTDEKVIEIPDPELLEWLQAKIQCALIRALEDKRCPTQE